MNTRNKQLSYVIKDGVVNISVGIDLLVFAVTKQDSWLDSLEITDNDKFAEAIIIAMQDETEDGTQVIHRAFDAAAEVALEYGTNIDPNSFCEERTKINPLPVPDPCGDAPCDDF